MPRSLSRRVASDPASRPLPPAPGRWYVAISRDPDTVVVVCDSEEEAREVYEDQQTDLQDGMYAILDQDVDDDDDDYY